MVDALASGASGRKAVEVRVLFWAPLKTLKALICLRVFLFPENLSTCLSTQMPDWRRVMIGKERTSTLYQP